MTETHKSGVRIHAPVKDVHHALTDPATLRVWLAEHAEVSLPERYEFWGRTTPEGDAPHQRLVHADDRSIRFTWLIDGVETNTSITLGEDGDDTLVDVEQDGFTMQEAMEGSTRGLLFTYWFLALARLVEHFEGRSLTPFPDFTSPKLAATMLINAPQDAVYRSLTDGEQYSKWWGMPIEIDPRPGGDFTMVGHMTAKIVDVEPGRRMSIDWGPVGISTWELEGSGGQTRLTVVQSGFDEANPPYGGWMGSFSGLAELRRFHEVPDWKPMYTHEVA